MNELVDVDITYDPQSQSVIVKNKEDGSVLSILDISETSDFMARINRMIAAAQSCMNWRKQLRNCLMSSA